MIFRLEPSTREPPRPPAIYDRLARQRPTTTSVSGDVITVAVSRAAPMSGRIEPQYAELDAEIVH